MRTGVALKDKTWLCDTLKAGYKAGGFETLDYAEIG
jgi:hypothetical protein